MNSGKDDNDLIGNQNASQDRFDSSQFQTISNMQSIKLIPEQNVGP